MELLIATTNAGKLREIFSILAGLPVGLKTLREFPDVSIADETGTTFAENAREKALHYARAIGMLTVAEDSGFEVDALNGAPGIYSARYLSPDATYPDRFAEIYRQTSPHLENGARTARFVCAVAVAQADAILFETTATVEGRLADAPGGENGFGYDPIFFYPPYGKTFGEVSDVQKTAVSHRGHAMRALRTYLEHRGTELQPG